MIKGQTYDAILFFAPSPMTSAITAIPLKYLKQAHLAVWVQDLWPESLSATGHVANPVILFIIKQMIRLIYRFSDTLLIQSRAFHEPVSRLADSDKIIYFPNFSRAIDTASHPASTELSQALLQLLENHFCIVFSGNLGTAQALHTVIGAADLLADLPQCKILLVGSGSMSGWLEQQIKDKNLQNVILTGRLPVEQMPSLYQHAQGLLVTLDDEEIFSYTVPSKVQGYLAAGRPIIAAINGEAAIIIQESGAGFSCMAEDTSALADNIRKLYHSTPEQRAEMGARGYKYFKEHFEMESQIRRLVEILHQRIVSQKA
jgi:glycosyltransferase involved in cell wall biosynthesis